MRRAERHRHNALPLMRILLLAIVVAMATVVPARAAEPGVLTGKVINQTTGKPAAGAVVRLSGADEDGSERIDKKVKVGPDGRYRFDGLPSEQDWLYVVDATFDGGLFPGSPFGFPQGQTPKLESSLKVWDTTTDPNSILITRDAMFVLPAENSVRVVESVNVLNHARSAYVGRGGAMGQAATTFGFGLPAGADEVQVQDASLDIPQLVETDFGFGITVALPPGESDFTYSYRVPASALTYVLSKTALYPTADLLVFVGEPLQLQSNRMRESETVTVEGKKYRRWVAPGMVDAGDTILLQATAQARMEALPFAVGGGVLLLLLSAGYMFMRRRQRDDKVVVVPEESRDDLIAAIASLDLAYESGSLEEKDWETARSRLKSRLIELERA